MRTLFDGPLQSVLDLQAVSKQFKEANPEIEVWHVLNRQFDGVPLFEFISHHLNDNCVIRLKISRNSNDKSINEDGKEWVKNWLDKKLCLCNNHIDIYQYVASKDDKFDNFCQSNCR